jgi:hypothetical protein
MAPTLTITGCTVDTSSITISFSAPVDQRTTDTGAATPDNFTVYDPAVAGFGAPTSPDFTWPVSFTPDGQTVTWTLPTSGPTFNPGDFVLIGVSNIHWLRTRGRPP